MNLHINVPYGTNDHHIAEAVCKAFAQALRTAKTIDPATFDLSVKNPNGAEEIKHRTPKQIMDEIAALDAESAKALAKIKALL